MDMKCKTFFSVFVCKPQFVSSLELQIPKECQSNKEKRRVKKVDPYNIDCFSGKDHCQFSSFPVTFPVFLAVKETFSVNPMMFCTKRKRIRSQVERTRVQPMISCLFHFRRLKVLYAQKKRKAQRKMGSCVT